MNIEKKLESLYNEMLNDSEWELDVHSIDEVKAFMDGEWGEGGHRGYGIFYDDHCTPKGEYFDCINRIDEYMIYDYDALAAKQAEKDGMCKLIHDIRIPSDMEIYPLSGTIIDNPHNRELLARLVEEHRELKKPRYAFFIYRKSDGELILESECTKDEMFIKKTDAKNFAKKELDILCRAFDMKPEEFEIEIEDNHYLI